MLMRPCSATAPNPVRPAQFPYHVETTQTNDRKSLCETTRFSTLQNFFKNRNECLAGGRCILVLALIYSNHTADYHFS